MENPRALLKVTRVLAQNWQHDLEGRVHLLKLLFAACMT
jgi:hypothetical protein